MSSLNLTTRPRIQLPASSFPDRADVYVCDKYGLDITKHLHPGQAHTWKAMGPERYRCQCGRNYLTAATEWNHFSEWERKRRIQCTLGFAAYLTLRYVFFLPRAGVIVGALIAAFPFLFMVVPFSLGVASSMWRTRGGTRTVSAQD